MGVRDYSSCRFDTYYQVQVWNVTALAWKGVAKNHGTEGEAADSVKTGTRFRVVEVSEAGRKTGEERVA